MADYKRFVSYMYEYEDGTKKKNVGYARVETRDGECRFTIHMQVGGLSEGIFPTYLIHRPKDEMDLVYIGDSAVRNQVMDSRLRVKEKNIEDTDYNFSDMGGVLLFLNSRVFYATQWDDKPVELEEVLDALKPKPKVKPKELDIAHVERQQDEPLSTIKIEKPKNNLDTSELSDDIEEESKEISTPDTSRPTYMLPGGYKIKEGKMPTRPQIPTNPWTLVKNYNESEELSKDIKHLDIKSKENLENIKPGDLLSKEKSSKDLVHKDTREKESVNLKDVMSRHKEKEKKPLDITDNSHQNSLAEKVFINYPRIYPFEDNEITRCVKIEPKDIGSLPSDTWILSNNSFLLHGYYCYHHLIFAEIVDRYGCRYIIGVPGIYHTRERFMARMFGFESFKSIRKRELKQGDFGYWYVDVNF